MQVFEIGSRIYAHLIKPGTVIEVDGQRVEVYNAVEHYSTVSFDNGISKPVFVGYADRVKVLGYFNL